MSRLDLACLISYAALSIVLFGLLIWLYGKYRKEKQLSSAVIFNTYWGVVAGGFVLLTILLSHPNSYELVQNLLASLGGAGLGWLLGIYFSPMGQSETKAFEKYGTALAGVLSGYTLKSAIEFARNNRHDLEALWVPITLFIISCFITTAVVYNSRAYNKLLEVHIKGDKPEMQDGAIKVPLTGSTTFYAEVFGPSDPAVKWDVSPVDIPKYEVNSCGVLTTKGSAAKCKLIATNIEDPTLSNSVDINIS